MNQPDPDRDLHPKVLRLAESVAEGTPIDWEGLREGEALDPDRIRSLALIDSVFRDYGRAADEIRERLHAPLLALDSRWGSLRVLERIGTGSFGQVFRAFDRSLARDVALKVLRDRPRAGNSGVPEFLEEARRLARVKHPGVLTVYGVAVHDGRAGIWTELLRGRTLEEILEADGPFDPEEAARIGIALCRSLSAIHAAGLIHRDLKTQNVMREEDGRVVLTDFGAMDERFDEARSEQTGYGSLLSAAPEILRGGRATPASDVYSLGVLLYRILSGRYPIEPGSQGEILAAARRGASPLSEARPGVPAGLAAAVDRALDPDPSRRFAGPNAMAGALQATLDPTLPARPAPAETWRPQRGHDSVAAPIAVGALISAVVAVGIWGLGIPSLERFRVTTDAAAPVRPAQTDGGEAGTPPAPSPPASTAPAGLLAEPVLYRAGELGNEPLADRASIDTGDQLFLEVQTGAEPVVCYVLDEDGAGIDYVLFPLPGYRLGNPLPAGSRYRLPDGPAGRTWVVDSENGRENVVVVTSTAPLPWFERMIRDFPRAVERESPQGVVTRGIGRTAPAPPTGRQAAVLDRLRSSDEFKAGRAGYWRIRLEAPPNR